METNAAGKKVYYIDYTWKELDALDRSAVKLVLPSGSVEQHGPHLTMGSDSTAASAVSLRAAKQVSDTIVLPCLWYTPCVDTSNYTGTVSIASVHFVNYVCDIFESLYRHGFRKLMIANVHGGAKTVLDVAIREFHSRMGTVNYAYDDDFFIHLHNIYNPAIEYLNGLAEGKDWGHAGEMETSLDMYLFPERVSPELPGEDYIPWQKGYEWYIGDMRAACESGVHGDPTKASVEKGRKVAEALVSAMVEMLETM